MCRRCSKKGHFAKVCRSNPATPGRDGITSATFPTLAAVSSRTPPVLLKSKDGITAATFPTLAAVSSRTPTVLLKSSTMVTINGEEVRALVDSGCTESFIHPDLVKKLNIKSQASPTAISMAQSSLSAQTLGYCIVDLVLNEKLYPKFCMLILPGLCSDILLGLDFQSQHQSVSFQHNGPKPPLTVCGLSVLKVESPDLFSNLTSDVHPIATKSRRYCREDQEFIAPEVRRLLNEGIIEPSKSPWRAQVVVTRNENNKKRMVVDYSQTVNRFTLLDAYPLPRIDDTICAIALYRIYSTIDLRSAYHQVKIKDCHKPYTAFQAGHALYQFTRIPFGVTNGVACFQRIMTTITEKAGLQGTITYMDNVTICGKDQKEHDRNLQLFQDVASQRNITYNDSKSVYSTRKLAILGYIVEEGQIRPDPDRLRPLLDLPVPKDTKSLRQVLGFFSHYSQWIQRYSEKIRPLTQTSTFPISEEAKSAFVNLKRDVEQSVVCAVDEDSPFEVETDASDFAIAATLSKKGHPVPFFSRTLQGPEVNHASVEKEAKAIIEAVRHWRHCLTGQHFIHDFINYALGSTLPCTLFVGFGN